MESRFTLPRVSVALAATLLAAGGCSRQQFSRQQFSPHHLARQFSRFDPTLPDDVMKDPLPDAAAVARNWDGSTLYYPSGKVVAFPVYYTTYETRPRFLESDAAYAVASPVIFLVDVALSPIRLVTQPPWSLVVYPGAQYGPSMTVAPPLPGNLPEGDKSEVPGNPAVQ